MLYYNFKVFLLRRSVYLCFVHIALIISINSFSQTSSGTIVLRDFPWHSALTARMIELVIQLNKGLLEGSMYKTMENINIPTVILKIADTIFILNTKSANDLSKSLATDSSFFNLSNNAAA